MAGVDTAPPPWCNLGTLPLDEPVDWQALKLISAGCQIYDQFHFAGCQIFTNFTLNPVYFLVQRVLHNMNFLT